MKKINVVTILGPTAVGKTNLAIELAKLIDAEIVNADSMQIYKGLYIGTAQPSKAEIKDISYHLIDFVDKKQEFNLYNYINLANSVIEDINNRNKTPILVGGTGLYIDTLINGVDLKSIPQNEEIKKQILYELENFGFEYLWDELNEIDKESALRINKNNVKRVVRALEINYLTGKPIGKVYSGTQETKSKYRTLFIGLKYGDREKLYKKINDRVDNMISLGLVKEACELFDKGVSRTAIQAIGYKEFKDYFNKKVSLDSVIDKIKQNTRRYAKRQMAWFKRNQAIEWIYVDEYEDFNDIVKLCFEKIKNFKEK